MAIEYATGRRKKNTRNGSVGLLGFADRARVKCRLRVSVRLQPQIPFRKKHFPAEQIGHGGNSSTLHYPAKRLSFFLFSPPSAAEKQSHGGCTEVPTEVYQPMRELTCLASRNIRTDLSCFVNITISCPGPGRKTEHSLNASWRACALEMTPPSEYVAPPIDRRVPFSHSGRFPL